MTLNTRGKFYNKTCSDDEEYENYDDKTMMMMTCNKFPVYSESDGGANKWV